MINEINKEKKWNFCKYCNYQWQSKSKLMYITCPNCRRKIKNIKVKKNKIIDFDDDFIEIEF